MRKIIATIATIGTIGFLTSCSDFLDEIPKGNITTASYYKTEQHAISATNAIYDFLIMGYAKDGLWDKNFGGLYFNNYWVMQDLFADNSHNNTVSTSYKSIDNMQIDKYNEPVELLWRDLYQTIKACNVVLDKVPGITMDDKLKKQLLAEARFFRALMYFDLVRMFGDVPLHLKDVATEEEENVARSSKEEVYKVIIADLKIAETDLQYSDRFGGGRPYPLSASALLARVYVTYGALHKDNAYYQLAVQKADEVIPSFPLMDQYEDLFKIANRFNSEIIYGVSFSGSLSAGWTSCQYLVRLLPNMGSAPGAPQNAQGWESATENLYDAYGNVGDKRKNAILRKEFVGSDNVAIPLTKPYFFKYWDRQAEPKGNTSDQIFPVLRTAEMYLIKAEALNEIHNGPTNDAVEAIKFVRNRAGVTTALPSDYAGFKKAILNEYRLEFAMEGHRWFDLTRMCTPTEFIAIIKNAKPNATPSATHFQFPIPQRDIELSNGVLSQNSGY